MKKSLISIFLLLNSVVFGQNLKALTHSQADSIIKADTTLPSGNSSVAAAIPVVLPKPQWTVSALKPDFYRIAWHMPLESNAQINIYNEKGQIVKNIWSSLKVTGPQMIFWDGTDSLKNTVKNGKYLIRLTTPTDTLQRLVQFKK